MKLTPEEQKKQEYYRDARTGGYYGKIWTTVGKCVFCDLRDKYIVHEENGMVLTVAMFPYIDGNVMIIPRRHVKSAKELTAAEWETVRKLMYVTKKMIRKVHGLKDVQYVLRDGGDTVNSTVQDHFHMHCIPFDAPDLSSWNYRTLKYTPLENASLYRKARKKIIQTGQKFDTEYARPYALQIFCDAVIINDKNEVLLMERSADATMIPPHDTTPGGHVDNFDRTIEQELAREILEETGLKVDPSDLRLVASRIDEVTYAKSSPHLNVRYGQLERFVYNTYRLNGIPDSSKLTAGDDARRLYWQPVDEALVSPRLTPAIQESIRLATQ